jgi:hypothetical protein
VTRARLKVLIGMDPYAVGAFSLKTFRLWGFRQMSVGAGTEKLNILSDEGPEVEGVL